MINLIQMKVIKSNSVKIIFPMVMNKFIVIIIQQKPFLMKSFCCFFILNNAFLPLKTCIFKPKIIFVKPLKLLSLLGFKEFYILCLQYFFIEDTIEWGYSLYSFKSKFSQ